MIEIVQGNILEADAEAIVNAVNCVGVMGKGLALQFKKTHPANFQAYRRECAAGQVHPGQMFIYATGRMDKPKYIINFPTKRHWRDRSRYDDIQAGLTSLVEDVGRLGIGSIAVPPLGCGLGGLEWTEVRPLIAAAFNQLPDVRVLLYEPTGGIGSRFRPAHFPCGSLIPDNDCPRSDSHSSAT
jgi:O-acetyl-ADP-ribose deacetylase (regulator of RNase III)